MPGSALAQSKAVGTQQKVAQVLPSFVYGWQVTLVAATTIWILLNEVAAGYYRAGIPADSDRPIMSIKIKNLSTIR